MSFPTSGERHSFALFLHLTGIRGVITEQRPDLADRTTVSEHGPLALTIDLPNDARGYHRRVVLHVDRSIPGAHWGIIGPHSGTLTTQTWRLDTPDQHLAHAAIALHDAILHNTDLPSPWRWEEPETSTIVTIADHLADQGLHITAVAGHNRCISDRNEGDERARDVPAHFGPALRIQTAYGTFTLAHKPTLGWVLDGNDGLSTRRLDIGGHATGTPSLHPGITDIDPHGLASAVKSAVSEPMWSAGDDTSPPAQIGQASPTLIAAAAWWMRELGYPETTTHGWDEEEITGPIHFVATTKRCGLAAVKIAFADAAVNRKQLAMFTPEGFTRDACTWADQAGAALYHTSADGDRIYPRTALAAEHLPQVL